MISGVHSRSPSELAIEIFDVITDIISSLGNNTTAFNLTVYPVIEDTPFSKAKQTRKGWWELKESVRGVRRT